MDADFDRDLAQVATPVYTQLSRAAELAFFEGKLAKARKLFEWVYTEAVRINEPLLLERTTCNQASVALSMRQGESYLPKLRQIGKHSADRMSRLCANNTLSNVFRERGQRQDAASFGASALAEAKALGRADLVASCLHNAGVLALHSSDLQAAQRFLEEAMALDEEEATPGESALAHSVLGYCLARLGQEQRAYRILNRGLARLSGRGASVYNEAVSLSVGFAMLELENFADALEEAETALSTLAVSLERKYALYLAGESYASLGFVDEARQYFGKLQEEFYPREAGLTDTLLSLRTHRLIGWLS